MRQSFLGTICIRWSDKGLEHIDITTHPVTETTSFEETPAWLQSFLLELDSYLEQGQAFSKWPQVNEESWTPFQKQIYQKLFSTRVGETLTYGELAARCNRASAARAVGSAMSHNTLPLLIPCHRVLPASGKLGRYTGGEGPLSKEKLLNHERRFAF